jgi:hypothetical protein
MNLAVKAMLYGSNTEMTAYQVIEDAGPADVTAVELQQEKRRQIAWRRQGPLGKLKNIIMSIKKTPQRRDTWKAAVVTSLLPENRATELITPNQTRWNGDYYAIQRALNLRDAVDQFVDNHAVDQGSIPGLADDALDADDWIQLQELVVILEPFERYTLELEGKRSNGALYDVFPVYDCLLGHLEEMKVFPLIYYLLQPGLF